MLGETACQRRNPLDSLPAAVDAHPAERRDAHAPARRAVRAGARAAVDPRPASVRHRARPGLPVTIPRRIARPTGATWTGRRAGTDGRRRRCSPIPQATKDDLVRAYGVDPGRCTSSIWGATRRSAPVRDDPSARGTFGNVTASPGVTFFMSALYSRAKTCARVIDAFAGWQVEPGLADVQLVLAGKRGWLYDRPVRQVDRLGLAGRASSPATWPTRRSARAAKRRDGLRLPIPLRRLRHPGARSGSVWRAVITSNTSSLPEVAGDAALLVDPHDMDAIAEAMYRLVTDAGCAPSSPAAARRTSSVSRGKSAPGNVWRCWRKRQVGTDEREKGEG